MTKCRRRRDDKACEGHPLCGSGTAGVLMSTPRSPRKHNAVSVDDCGTAVDKLCMIPAKLQQSREKG